MTVCACVAVCMAVCMWFHLMCASFRYLTLVHSETFATAQLGAQHMTALAAQAPASLKKRFDSLVRVARQHADVLARFGRYPHRNAILGRPTTPDEADFLATSRYGFMRSVLPAEQRGAATRGKKKDKRGGAPKQRAGQVVGSNKTKAAPQRILLLHSFRQNAVTLRKGTKKLRLALKGIADIVYANAPLPYNPQGETRDATLRAFGTVPDQSRQRCWWNSSEGNREYVGIDASLELIQHLFRTQGPFDGVFGFSQGGAMAGILSALQPVGDVKFRYAIIVSGFPSRADAHQKYMRPGTIHVPSLHVWGTSDILVDNARSEQLSKCFVEPQVVTHGGGHFVPTHWPLSDIAEFVARFAPDVTAAISSAGAVAGGDVDDSVVVAGLKSKMEASLRRLNARGLTLPPPVGLAPQRRAQLDATGFWTAAKHAPDDVDRAAATAFVEAMLGAESSGDGAGAGAVAGAGGGADGSGEGDDSSLTAEQRDAVEDILAVAVCCRYIVAQGDGAALYVWHVCGCV